MQCTFSHFEKPLSRDLFAKLFVFVTRYCCFCLRCISKIIDQSQNKCNTLTHIHTHQYIQYWSRLIIYTYARTQANFNNDIHRQNRCTVNQHTVHILHWIFILEAGSFREFMASTDWNELNRIHHKIMYMNTLWLQQFRSAESTYTSSSFSMAISLRSSFLFYISVEIMLFIYYAYYAHRQKYYNVAILLEHTIFFHFSDCLLYPKRSSILIRCTIVKRSK